MKIKFKELFKKYINNSNSFLKDLSKRKLKIKAIWTQSNFQKENNISKNKNLKTEIPFKKFNKFINSNSFQNFSYKDIKFSFIKKNSKKKKTKKKQAKNSNLFNYLDITPLKILISNKLKIPLNKISRNVFTSQTDLSFIDAKLDKYFNFRISSLIKKINKKRIPKSKKNFELLADLLGIYYVNNKLYIAHLQRKNDLNIIKDIVMINVPSNLIGDYKIEKTNEVKGIINDVVNVFELNNPPIILLLSSSFFTTKSFSDSELVIFSDEDPVILSKSPYLPDNTLVQYKRANGDKNSSYHRIVYANKEVIDSWINAISLTGSDIATVTCPAIHLIEKIPENSGNDIYILCDVEDFTTSVYILRNNCELFSTRLPFGSSFYITDQESLNKQFFSRLDKSVKNILSQNKLASNDTIYLNGNGIDKMLSINDEITEGFVKIPASKYKLNPDKSLDFKKDDTILNSFSNTLDDLMK